MPRTGRVVVPGYPHHVVQRGHDRKAVFACDHDYIRYLDDLQELKEKYGVLVHAYCLMTNHIHLLLCPVESAAGMGLLMKALAGRATRYRNKLERRSGTLWEGRYKSSPVQTDKYLLACNRYIELNPVRARMVDDPGMYPWSSYRQHTEPGQFRWIDLDASYIALGRIDPVRARIYQRFAMEPIPTRERDLIRQATQRGQLTGDKRFTAAVADILGRRIEFRGQGRPSKPKSDRK